MENDHSVIMEANHLACCHCAPCRLYMKACLENVEVGHKTRNQLKVLKRGIAKSLPFWQKATKRQAKQFPSLNLINANKAKQAKLYRPKQYIVAG